MPKPGWHLTWALFPQTPYRAAGLNTDDVYFMGVALLIAKKSPDPNTKVSNTLF